MKVHELLDSPEKWTTKANARDKEGDSIPGDWEQAVCWCLGEAIRCCYTTALKRGQVRKLVRDTIEIGIPIYDWNDAHTYEEVRALALKLDI